MKKKIGGLLVALLVALAAGCATDLSEVTVTGFEVEQSISVQLGTYVKTESPLVTDSGGNVLSVWVHVADSKGGYIPVQSGEFLASDSAGYTITYTVRASDNRSHKKQTAVSVLDESGFEIGAVYEQVVQAGKTIEIVPLSEQADAAFSYSVIKKSDGTSVDVDTQTGTFICPESGTYVVNIVATADGKSAFYNYEIVAIRAITDGLIESFDENWAEVSQITGDKRINWQVTDTAESGIKDHRGNDASFLTATVTDTYVFFYINPMADKSYYQALAGQGYEYVSMWIYMESQNNISHITAQPRDPAGGFYQIASPTLRPGYWTEIQVPLTAGKEDWQRSFLDCFEMYDSQECRFFQIDNSNEWNPDGGGDTMTFYVSDIYAVKPVSVSVDTTAATEREVGESVDFSEVFDAGTELSYTASFRGKTLALTENYKFKANGTYVVTASPERADYAGSKSVTFTVTDDFNLTADSLARQLIGGGAEFLFSDLNAAISPSGGVTPSVDDYAVTFNGNTVVSDASGFTATIEGTYEIEIVGTYEIDGELYHTYCTAYIDAYTEENRFVAIAPDNMHANSYYSWEGGKSFDDGIYTVDGKEQRMFHTPAKGEGLIVTGRPKFSKSYYQGLIADNPDMSMMAEFSYYFKQNVVSHDITTLCAIPTFADTTVSQNLWYTVSMPLTTFIEHYDALAAGYAAEISGARTDNHLSSANDYLLHAYIADRFDDLYLTGMTVKKDVQTLGTVLIDRTGVTEYDIMSKAAIESAADKWTNAGYTLSYTVEARYGGKIVNEGTTLDMSASVESGIYYLTAAGELNGQSQTCFTATLDIYNSTEAVEYESFTHSDSAYAVTVYYVNAGSDDMRTEVRNVTEAYSAADVVRLNAPTVVYGTESVSENIIYGTADVGYVGVDMSKLVAGDPLTITNKSWVYFYVMPRHTSEYYELYAATHGNLAFGYSGGGGGQNTRVIKTISSTLAYRSQQVWSNNMQTGAATDTTVTINTIIGNYDAFAQNKIAVYGLYNSHGGSFTETAKLYAITFLQEEQAD